MHLFTRLPITVSGSLPVIPSADIQSLVNYEQTSYEHWIFSGGAGALVGKKAGKALTLQSTAPTYSAYYLSFGGNGKALLTDLMDSAAATDTVCVVMRPAASVTMQVPFGNVGSVLGGSPLIYGTPTRTLAHTYRGISNSGNQTAISPAAWQFLAISRNFSGTTKSIRMLLGGTAQAVTTNSGTYTPAATPIALGNSSLAGVGVDVIDYAEFIIFPTALDATELEAVYQRAKARCAARGLAVV